MKRISIAIFLLLAYLLSFPQVGIGTLSPNERSVLELYSTPGKGRGLLIPRMITSTRRGMEIGNDSIGTPLSSEHTSLLLFDQTQDLFYHYNANIQLATSPANYNATGTIAEDARVWQILNPWKTQYAWDGSKQLVNLLQDTAATGFVGIGWVDYSESPTFPLHVKGDGYFDNSNLTVDKTIDATKVVADTIGEDKETLFEGFGIVPIGTVVSWSGVWTADIEAKMIERGWYLCDDKHADDATLTYKDLSGEDRRIPNLSGRFIVGLDGRAAPTGDADYELIGTTGPNYGTVNGISRDQFYELEENGKRVKLLEPAMPRHDHGEKENIFTLPTVERELDPIVFSRFSFDYSDLYFYKKTGTINGFLYYDNLSGVTSDYLSTANIGGDDGYGYPLYEHTFENLKNGTPIELTSNHTHDTNGGYTFTNITPNVTETAMPIENRPPYYVLAYIIRVK